MSIVVLYIAGGGAVQCNEGPIQRGKQRGSK